MTEATKERLFAAAVVCVILCVCIIFYQCYRAEGDWLNGCHASKAESTGQMKRTDSAYIRTLRDSISTLHDSIEILVRTDRGRSTYRHVVVILDSSGAPRNIDLVETTADTAHSETIARRTADDRVRLTVAGQGGSVLRADSAASVKFTEPREDHFRISLFAGGTADMALSPDPGIIIGASARFSWHVLYTEISVRTDPLKALQSATAAITGGIQFNF